MDALIQNNIRSLLQQYDSISIDDDFIRHLSPDFSDEFEIIINLENTSYEFTKDSLDNATLSNGEYSVFCSYNEYYVKVRFYQVTQIDISNRIKAA